MITVGILANNPVWEEYLTAFSQGAPFRIIGRSGDPTPENLQNIDCLANSDALWIPELTPYSMEAAIFSLRQSHHVLFGFPVVDFQSRADLLLKLAREANVDVQVGHHDRYHPAFRAVKDQLHNPQFIRVRHELREFIPANQEQMLLQQILYDVDAVMALIPEPLKKVQAHISRISKQAGRMIDIRMDFHNGSAASINFSNLGFRNSRLIDITDYQSYYTIDLLQGTSSSFLLSETGPEETRLWPVNGLLGINNGQIDEESLTRECLSFFQRRAVNSRPLASLEDGYEALRITEIILKKIGLGVS